MSAADNTAPAIEPEQAAMLATLEAEAAGEPPIPGTPEAIAAEEAASKPPIDLGGELAGLLQVVAGILTPALPSLGAIYTEANCQAAGAAVASVCNKHGWLQGGILGGYAEELAAVAVLGPMAMATYAGVKADLAKAKAEPAAPTAVSAP